MKTALIITGLALLDVFAVLLYLHLDRLMIKKGYRQSVDLKMP
ncbi:hypothetical protein ACS126_13090 [Sphingobacterium lactis]